MFSVLKVFTHTVKNESIVNLYQKELLGCLSEDINKWRSHNECNWHSSNWSLFNIYVDSIEYSTVQKIFADIWSTVQSSKYQNKTAFKIAALGLQSLCDNGSFIIILSEILCAR